MLEKDNIILLGNNNKFLIIDKITYNGSDYLYLTKVNEEETDFEGLSDIAKVNFINNSVELLTVEDEYEIIKEAFLKRLENSN